MLKTEHDIAGLRASGALLKTLLDMLRKLVAPGVALADLDRAARDFLAQNGAESAFLGYKPAPESEPYPAAICASVNGVVVHGIPGKYALKEGDILSLDAGVRFRGYITDAAITVGVGRISAGAEKLLKGAEAALVEAVAMCEADKTVGDIGWSIEKTAGRFGLGVVRALTGHGVGFELHESPTIYNYGSKGSGPRLEVGMVLAIEPMFASGSGETREEPDGSFVTADGSLAAHFEHTVAVTETGPEILTN